MKCAKCQTELERNGTCKICGEAGRPATDRFSVSFKKFGTSELLEISPKKKEGKAASSPPQQPQKPRPLRPLPNKPADEGNNAKAFLFAAAAVLLVVLITAIFFWFFYGRH